MFMKTYLEKLKAYSEFPTLFSSLFPSHSRKRLLPAMGNAGR